MSCATVLPPAIVVLPLLVAAALVGGALLAENAGAALDEIEQVSNQIANLVQNEFLF